MRHILSSLGRPGASAVVVIAAATAPSPARAADDASVGALVFAVPAVLRGPPIAPAARFGGGRAAGALLGVDGGYSVLLASGGAPSDSAAAFGVRAGYDLGNGLAIDGRYDLLGVRETSSAAHAVTLGGRYALPLVVMPFVEVRTGVSFDAEAARFCAAAGLGLAVPLSRPLALSFTARDWLSAPDGRVRSDTTLELGATVTFGRAHR